MRDFKIGMRYGMGDFEEKAKRLMDDISLESQDIIRRSAVVFANAAAKWTPPRRGGSPSMTIPKEKYERPFVLLGALVAGGYPGLAATDIDRAQLKRGMKFKVYSTKKHQQSKAPAFAYCRTKGELKRLRRIANRGLAKAMWGKSLATIGVNVPLGIQRLIGKSPALAGLDYSETALETRDAKVSVTITNSASDVEKYASAAERYGYDRAMAELRHRLAAIAKRGQKL